MSFPVPLQGFPTSVGEEIAGSAAFRFIDADAVANGISKLSGKAAFTPVMGETWGIEALLLNTIIEYEVSSNIDITAAEIYLNTKIVELEADKLFHEEKALTELEGAAAQIRALWVKEGSPVPSELAERVLAAEGAVQQARAGLVVTKNEIADVKREREELGRPGVLEQFASQPVAMRAELKTTQAQVLLTSLDSFDKQTIQIRGWETTGEGELHLQTQNRVIREYYAQRIELNESPEVLQSDNIELDLSAYVTPRKLGEVKQGVFVPYLKLAVVSAGLQCSVAGSLART